MPRLKGATTESSRISSPPLSFGFFGLGLVNREAGGRTSRPPADPFHLSAVPCVVSGLNFAVLYTLKGGGVPPQRAFKVRISQFGTTVFSALDKVGGTASLGCPPLPPPLFYSSLSKQHVQVEPCSTMCGHQNDVNRKTTENIKCCVGVLGSAFVSTSSHPPNQAA